MIIRRRLVSVDEVTKRLDALARENHLADHCYEESASESLSEFDAIKWNSLCAQRRALIERESVSINASVELPSPFVLLYGKVRSSVHLKNAQGGLGRLAA